MKIASVNQRNINFFVAKNLCGVQTAKSSANDYNMWPFLFHIYPWFYTSNEIKAVISSALFYLAFDAITDDILFNSTPAALSVLINALLSQLLQGQKLQLIDGLEKIDEYINDDRYFF